MSNHPMTDASIGFYTDVCEKVNFTTRVNAIPPRIAALIQQLSEETMKRYYGSGIVIPENIKGARILDVGCGSGSLVFLLAKLVGPTGYVVGVDATESLIEQCKKQTDYHAKTWGYEEPNFEFRVANAERLSELNLGEFDVVVSNGVFCLLPDQDKGFKEVVAALKPGGVFYLSDVYAKVEVPEELKTDNKLWVLGTAGAMVWARLQELAQANGLTIPYTTYVAGVNIKSEEIKKLLNNEFACAASRMFKLPVDAKRGAATVTYKGDIEDNEEVFKWDVDLTFKKDEPTVVDEYLATILTSTVFKDNFVVEDFDGEVQTKRNQDPFKLLADLTEKGAAPETAYDVE
ncbi:unnamed protein product [Lymnaea stagnalis]|uniref:Arsenite methyltransferase n=1 Tax=Lymnaea stagnalis TaxID=6523 RepID=A0AAV2HKG9_LYMST